MKITTKYDIGNTVFFLSNNKITDAIVSEITIVIKGGIITILYETKISIGMLESEVFKTKNALLKSL